MTNAVLEARLELARKVGHTWSLREVAEEFVFEVLGDDWAVCIRRSDDVRGLIAFTKGDPATGVPMFFHSFQEVK